MGDTNTRYTTSGEPIATFAADNAFTDAWVEPARGGTAPPSRHPRPDLRRDHLGGIL